MGILHMQVGLLNGVCKVWTREGQILQSTDDAPVERRIGDALTINTWELAFCVNWSRSRLAMCHARAVEHLVCILLLGEEETIGRSSDLNAKEEMYRSKVLHSKFVAKLIDDVVQQRRGRSSQHDVVDVQKKVCNVGAAL